MATIDRIRAKWDAAAAPQLRAELDRLQAEIDRLQTELDQARRDADYYASEASYQADMAELWQQDAMDAIEAAGMQPGLTIDGRLVPAKDPA